MAEGLDWAEMGGLVGNSVEGGRGPEGAWGGALSLSLSVCLDCLCLCLSSLGLTGGDWRLGEFENDLQTGEGKGQKVETPRLQDDSRKGGSSFLYPRV